MKKLISFSFKKLRRFLQKPKMIKEGATGDNKTPLTKEFLESILNQKIVSFKTGEGSNPGDNYTSILVSLEIHLVGEEEPMHLLFKTFPQHPTRQKLLEQTNLFLKEYLMYDTWIPELINFQLEIVGNERVLKPSVPTFVTGSAIDYENVDIDVNEDPIRKNFILMVDERKTNGFKMADKTRSLGYRHVKIVLDELAKLHALGHAYKVHKNLANVRTMFPFISDPFFCNPGQKATVDAMVRTNFCLIRQTLQEFLYSNPEISASLSKFEEEGKVSELMATFLNPNGMDENDVENLIRAKPEVYVNNPPLNDQWIVAGHGDCWTNNMLFKSDETGTIRKAMFVDLQLSKESCVMADLVYFLYTSTDTEFRKKHLEQMLRRYYDSFLEYSKMLKVSPFPGFSWDNFKRKFHRSKIFGFLFAIIVNPIILCKPETSVDLDTLDVGEVGKEVNGDEIADMILKSSARDDDDKKLLRDRFTSLLSEMYDEGVL